MTFREITDAVLLNLFDESQRADAKGWVNHRYGWLLALEEWSFLNDTGAGTVTAGSQTVTALPADMGVVIGVWGADGRQLKAYSDWRAFMARYNSGLGSTGTPEAFTMIGTTMLVGPTPTAGETLLVAYELEGAALSADGDVPIIPALFHLALVHGGRAEGMKLQHNPTWRDVEQDFLASIEAMRRRYLVAVRQTGEQVPAYRP